MHFASVASVEEYSVEYVVEHSETDVENHSEETVVEHVYGFVERGAGEFHLGFYGSLAEDRFGEMKNHPQIFALGNLVGFENLGGHHCGFPLDLTVYVFLHYDWDLPHFEWTQMPKLFLEKDAQMFLLGWEENGCQQSEQSWLTVYHQILGLNLSGYTMVIKCG